MIILPDDVAIKAMLEDKTEAEIEESPLLTAARKVLDLAVEAKVLRQAAREEGERASKVLWKHFQHTAQVLVDVERLPLTIEEQMAMSDMELRMCQHEHRNTPAVLEAHSAREQAWQAHRESQTETDRLVAASTPDYDRACQQLRAILQEMEKARLHQQAALDRAEKDRREGQAARELRDVNSDCWGIYDGD